MEERTAPECGCVTSGKIVRGMCATHYYRWYDATPKEERGPSPKSSRRFADYVDRRGADDCWPWTGPTDKQGYGKWTKNNAHRLAHRVALAEVELPPDPNLFACHHCDNPPCCNPAHLYWGTPTDNRQDIVKRGGTWNKGKYLSHCKRGHEMVGDNLRIVGKDRQRTCRACAKLRYTERRAALA